jgi:hypothetical protein
MVRRDSSNILSTEKQDLKEHKKNHQKALFDGFFYEYCFYTIISSFFNAAQRNEKLI